MNVGDLTQEQIDTFHRDGYLIGRGMYTAEEITEISRWIDEIAAYPEVPGKYMMYFEDSKLDGSRILNRMENFYPYHKEFRRLFDSSKMMGSVGQLFGEPAVLFKDKINFKLPGGDGFKPHQDVQAGWDRYGSLHISVLLCIDDATLENGCLELVRGYHNRGLVGSQWTPLTDEDMQGMQLEPCPTRPGDVVFFDSYAPHASGPNLTDQRRRLLYITYGKRAEGDRREQYYADKRKSYPPDCEREQGKQYVFRV
ncbi:MAG: phytanoyl-CoA dioxygenase family protein [Chromatiales bacterium]